VSGFEIFLARNFSTRFTEEKLDNTSLQKVQKSAVCFLTICISKEKKPHTTQQQQHKKKNYPPADA
jgi:hypothetical protein